MAVELHLDVERFVSTEYPRVVAALRLITGKYDGAPEAVQDTIVRLVSTPPRVAPADYAAWITVAASRRIRDTPRRKGTHKHAGPQDQARTIHIRAYTRVVTEALYYGVNRDATCSWPSPTNSVANVDYDIALNDLVRGVTVTGDLWRDDLRPGTERTSRIQYTMTLQATRVER